MWAFFSFWFICLLCFVVAWKARYKFHNVIRDSLSHPKKLSKNFLSFMPIVACMSLTTITAIHSLQEGYGVPTGIPPLPSDPFGALFSLTYASIIEEIGFRLGPIGAFLVLYLFWTKRETIIGLSFLQMIKTSLLVVLYPEKRRTAFDSITVIDSGIRTGISIAEWIVLLLTSALFGLSHYPLSAGWELGKITTSFIDGLIFGVVYLMYGAHASILLHWFRNYYLYIYYFLALKFFPILFPMVAIIEIITFGYNISFFHFPSLGELGWLILIVFIIYKKFIIRFFHKRS